MSTVIFSARFWSVKNTVLMITILSLVYLIGLAFRAGLADIFASQSTQQMVAWTKTKQMPTQTQWQFTLGAIQRAHYLHPEHPDYFEVLGRIFEWRALMDDEQTGDAATKRRRQALQYFRRAVELRPVWPYGWASLALTKQRLNEVDVDFVHAMTQAIYFGAHDGKVQLMIADAGLAVWRELNPQAQQQVMQMVANGMEKKPAEMTIVAQRHLMLGLVCANIRRTDTNKRYCQDVFLKKN